MSEKILGKREIIKIKEEETFATVPSGDYMLLNNAKLTPNNIQEFEVIDGKGTDSMVSGKEAGVQDVKFSLEFTPRDWRMLVFAVGDSTNVDNTTYYTHTISRETDKSIPSFTLQRVFSLSGSNIVRTYQGCKVDMTTITWNTQGSGKTIKIVMECTASYMVTNVAEATGETQNTNCVFQSRQTKLTLDSNIFTDCYSGSLVIENKLNDGWYTNNDNRSETNPTKIVITGSAIGNYDSNDFFALWAAGDSVSNCSLAFTRASNDDITISFTNLVIPSLPDPTDYSGINVITINFEVEDYTIVAKDDRSDY